MIMRVETAGDVAGIYRVIEAAFGKKAEAMLVDALRAAGDVVLSLVAEENREVLGHVLFSRLLAPAGCLAMAPVSVRPDRQKSGIGSALINESIARLRVDGWKAIFVLGQPGYYTRFGFRVAAAARFTSAYPPSHFMALELEAGVLGALDARVVHPRAFEMV